MIPKCHTNYRLETYLTKNAEPLILLVPIFLSGSDLCRELLSLYNLPPATDIILKNFKTEMDEFHLSELEKVDARFNNKFLISFSPMDLEIDIFYQFLTGENAFPSPLVTAHQYKAVILHNSQRLQGFKKHFFHRQLLYLTIKDRIKGHTSHFFDFLHVYFQEDPKSPSLLFPEPMIISVLTEIIGTMFADKYEWISEDTTTGKPTISDIHSDFYEISNFAKLIIDLIEKGCQMKFVVRTVLDEFKPSNLMTNLVQIITDEIRSRFDNGTAYVMVNELFGSEWLYYSFPESSRIETFLMRPSYFDLFPYLVLRFNFPKFLKEEISRFDMEAICNLFTAGTNLFITKKSIKALIKSMLCVIYEIVESEDSPCLVLSQAKQQSILTVLGNSGYIFKKYCKSHAYNQKEILHQLSEFLENHNFEPKGLTFILVDYFLKAGLIDEEQLELYFEQTPPSSPYRESMMAEINTFRLSPICHILNDPTVLSPPKDICGS